MSLLHMLEYLVAGPAIRACERAFGNAPATAGLLGLYTFGEHWSDYDLLFADP